MPGSEYFNYRKEKNAFFFDMYNLKQLMLTIHTCYIFVVRFTFINQQRTSNISEETGGRYD